LSGHVWWAPEGDIVDRRTVAGRVLKTGAPADDDVDEAMTARFTFLRLRQLQGYTRPEERITGQSFTTGM